MKDGSVGYIHKANGAPVEYKPEPKREKPVVDIEAAWLGMEGATKPEWLDKVARQLGVSEAAVKALGAAWYGRKQAWAFPMRDGTRKVIGIRLRSEHGKKWALVGSSNGLFIPEDDYFAQVVYLVEGPTDVMAGVTMGLKIIGRPSCSAGVPFILEFIKQNKVRKLVIIADNDKPGLDGAEVLAHHLTIPSLTLTLPVKDLRAFLKFNGTKQMLQSLEKSMSWRYPTASGRSLPTSATGRTAAQ